jgi:hypothetical protein
MFAKIIVTLSENETGIVLDEHSVLAGEKNASNSDDASSVSADTGFVFVVANSTIVKRGIKFVRLGDGRLRVTEGLSKGEALVVKPNSNTKEGTNVSITKK